MQTLFQLLLLFKYYMSQLSLIIANYNPISTSKLINNQYSQDHSNQNLYFTNQNLSIQILKNPTYRKSHKKYTSKNILTQNSATLLQNSDTESINSKSAKLKSTKISRKRHLIYKHPTLKLKEEIEILTQNQKKMDEKFDRQINEIRMAGQKKEHEQFLLQRQIENIKKDMQQYKNDLQFLIQIARGLKNKDERVNNEMKGEKGVRKEQKVKKKILFNIN